MEKQIEMASPGLGEWSQGGTGLRGDYENLSEANNGLIATVVVLAIVVVGAAFFAWNARNKAKKVYGLAR